MTNISDYWKVYQRALLPKTAPHLPPRTELLSTGYLVKNKLLFARWLSDFDCGFETEWYCVIKDDNFSVDSLKAKRRYEINKGNKNFYYKIVDANENSEQFYRIACESYTVYPSQYRPILVKSKFVEEMKRMGNSSYVFVAIYDRLSNVMQGFALLNCKEEYIYYAMHKVVPSQERKGANAALVSGVLDFYQSQNNAKYIMDGERAIRHITGFQNYLIKYFGFRKAYCKLNILYNPIVKGIINVLYPIRKFIGKFTNNRIVYGIYCVLEQERIRRTFL